MGCPVYVVMAQAGQERWRASAWLSLSDGHLHRLLPVQAQRQPPQNKPPPSSGGWKPGFGFCSANVSNHPLEPDQTGRLKKEAHQYTMNRQLKRQNEAELIDPTPPGETLFCSASFTTASRSNRRVRLASKIVAVIPAWAQVRHRLLLGQAGEVEARVVFVLGDLDRQSAPVRARQLSAAGQASVWSLPALPPPARCRS